MQMVTGTILSLTLLLRSVVTNTNPTYYGKIMQILYNIMAETTATNTSKFMNTSLSVD